MRAIHAVATVSILQQDTTFSIIFDNKVLTRLIK